MRIATVITSFLPGTAYGGPIYSTTQRVAELTRRGHEVTVITSNLLDPYKKSFMPPGEEIHPSGFKILRFSSKLLAHHFSAVVSPSMLFWLARHGGKFDVFHISHPRELIPILAAELVMRRFPARVLLQTHGMLDRMEGPRKWVDALIVRRHLTEAAGVIVLQEDEDRIVGQIAPNSKRHIIPNGINLEPSFPLWSVENFTSPVILFLARLHPRKRVLDFVHAAKDVLAFLPHARFRVVGPDGGDESRARALARDLGLTEKMDFVGPVSRTQALQEFASAAVYVLPSDAEPFATSVVEALAVGTPVVVTNTTCNLGLLLKWDAVEVVDLHAHSIALGIINLATHRELCLTRSENGRKLIREELAIQKTVGLLEKIYGAGSDDRPLPSGY